MFLTPLQNNLGQSHASCDSLTVLFQLLHHVLSSTMHDRGDLGSRVIPGSGCCCVPGLRAGGCRDSAGQGKPAAVRRGCRLLPLCQILPSLLLLTGPSTGGSCRQRRAVLENGSHFHPGLFSSSALGRDPGHPSKL